MAPLATQDITLHGRRLTIAGDPADAYFCNAGGMAESLEGLRAVVLNHVAEDAVALDVGANIGLTSLLLSEILPRGRVLAFEPAPSTFRFLEHNLRENGASNAVPHRLAVSSAPGTLAFHESAYGAGSHLVTPTHIAADRTPAVAVEARRLDDIVAEAGLERVDFVKVDVEGFELDVLDGMEETLRRFRPLVFMEFNAWTTIAFRNLNPRVLLDRFLELCPHAHVVAGASLRPLGPASQMAFLHDNLVRHGCVDDIVGSPDPARFGPSGRVTPPAPEDMRPSPPVLSPTSAPAVAGRITSAEWLSRFLRPGR